MPDPITDIETLTAEYPIAMLPVRIETRFVLTSSHELLIRVYPDEIVANLHDPALFEHETEAGQKYWITTWDGSTDEEDAWREIVARYPPPRAAWIVHRLTPLNLDQRPSEPPLFPSIEKRELSLVTATARALPDCWIALAYRGGVEVRREIGKPITRPLALSYRLDVAEGAPELVARDELAIEPELLWTIDFEAAVQAGMALRMPLNTVDVESGFDRLLVIGVNTALTPADGVKALTDLLDAHHYTRGLALVPQGTATNNSAAVPAGYPAPSDPAHSFGFERDSTALPTSTDGALLAQAFGVPAATFARIEGARGVEQVRARAMNEALWPCTMGYFLEQMMRPVAADDDIAWARAHFIELVRGRGPLPAFRVGRVPYGVLPTISMQQWKPAADTASFETRLAGLVASWRTLVRQRIPQVARVGRTSDPDADLLGVLALDASCREVRARETLGIAFFNSMLGLLGQSPASHQNVRNALIQGVLAAAGLDGAPLPRVAMMTWADHASRIDRPFVTYDALSETALLADNYIQRVRQFAIDELQMAGRIGTPEFTAPLLFHLLRQAALVEYNRLATAFAIVHGAASPIDRIEPELVGISPGTRERETPWQRFAAPLPPLTGDRPLGDWLLDNTSDEVQRFRAALDVLAATPTAELERLTSESLDTCSHRLDAWITSLASSQLARMRAQVPQGIYLGAYAWVEKLKIRSGSLPGSGGYIHAPSPSHAATAAILRNAHLTQTGAARERAAVNLSSSRVRTALGLIDGVNQGQPLGAVLGYRFERALHDRAVDQYIAPFRRLYPLGRDPAAAPEAASERIAARDVTNGLALRTALAGSSPPPWSDATKLPPVAVADRTKVAECLALIDAAVDATADLLVAESVYQAVQGNTDRASATLASLAGGDTTPTPQITSMPRGGTSFSQRVAIVLGAPPSSPAPGWATTSARRIAEPRLDAWLSRLFGAPSNVHCIVTIGSEPAAVAPLSLAGLGLGALDVLALAQRGEPGELEARVIWHLRTVSGVTEPVSVDFNRLTGWPATIVSFPELFELARLVGDTLAAARPLVDGDLALPGPAAAPDPATEAELAARASAALARLEVVMTSLAAAIAGTSVTALGFALWDAAGFGVRGTAPSLDDELAVLRDRATIARAELERRGQAAGAATTAAAQLAALFGPELPVLPVFAPGGRAELDAALAYGPTLVGDPLAPRAWFERAAGVRAPLATFRITALATDAVSNAPIDLEIAQIPHRPGARWIALPFDPAIDAQQPRPDACSIAIHRALDHASGAWSGLLLDEWLETIPVATQQTAFAVHHDAPGAEAGQCVLLAVPSPEATRWNLSSLAATVDETLDLAAIRAVDLELLGQHAVLTPCLYLAANAADESISVDLGRAVIGEPAVVAHS